MSPYKKMNEEKPLSKTKLDEWLNAIHGTDYRWRDDNGNPVSSHGVVSVIAKRMGVNRRTVYRAKKKWAAIDEAIQDEKETLKDFAESKIYQHISRNNIAMTIFYAKTQMQDRGYVEKLIIEGRISLTLINDTIKALEDSGVDATDFFERARARALMDNASND